MTTWARGHGRARGWAVAAALAALFAVAWAPGAQADLSAVERPGVRQFQVPTGGGGSGAVDQGAVREACSRIEPRRLILVRGEIGTFEGYARVADVQGLSGLRTRSGEAPPPEPLTWDRIHTVHTRGLGWRKGALVGGAVVGAFGAYVGYVAESEGLFEYTHGTPGQIAAATLTGAAMGAVVGAVLGAGVGSLFPAWIRVYERP